MAHEMEIESESGYCIEVKKKRKKKKCRSEESVNFRHLDFCDDFGFCQMGTSKRITCGNNYCIILPFLPSPF